MRRRRTRPAKLVGAITCSFALLMLFMAPWAIADDGLTDAGNTLDETVDETIEVVDDAADDVTDAVGEVASATGDTVTDASGATNDVIGSASESTGSAELNTRGETNTAPADAITGAADGTTGSDTGNGSGGQGGRDTRDRTVITRQDRGDSADSNEAANHGSRRWNPINPLGSTLDNASGGVFVQQSSGGSLAAKRDPCRDDTSLVCLGLLYGFGKYADHWMNVLGIVATTGIGLIGLMVLSLTLGIAGSGALVTARVRSVVGVGRFPNGR
jgi:hypothetical protein